jgi:ADP-heptose:LPS heptosyltransferase
MQAGTDLVRGAYGDCIMATSQCKGHFSTTGRRVAFGNRRYVEWSSVFEGNPNVASPQEVAGGHDVDWIPNWSWRRPYLNPELTTTARLVYTDWRASPGELFLTAEERQWARCALGDLSAQPFIVIGAHTKNDVGGNKNWLFERWTAVAAGLSIPVIQSGVEGERTVPGAIRLITPTFRHAAAVLRQSIGFIGTEGGLHHASAALGLPAVVLFGGFVHPRTTGYDFHVNLFRGDEPCGLRVRCEHCRAAMRSISVDEVLAAARKIFPLPSATTSRSKSELPRHQIVSPAQLRMDAQLAANSYDFTTIIDRLETLVGISEADAEDLLLLGGAYLAAESVERAAEVLHKALAVDPFHTGILTTLAFVERRLGNIHSAYELVHKAIEAGDRDPTTYLDYGVLAELNGDIRRALHAYQSGVDLTDEATPELSLSLARIQFLLGDIEQASVAMLCRRDCQGFDAHRSRYALKWWRPDDPATTRLLVWPADQGLGDQVMFSTLLEEFGEQYPQVTFACDDRIAPIIRRAVPTTRVISVSEIPSLLTQGAFDAQATPMCLMSAVRLRTERSQPRRSAITANTALRAECSRRYGTGEGTPVIGFSWYGGMTLDHQTLRSVPLREWGSVLSVKGVRFVSLQYDPTLVSGLAYRPNLDLAQMVHSAAAQFQAEILVDSTVDSITDLERWIAQIAACDHVVTVDNTVAHLAGALGIATTVLLPIAPCWRWLSEIRHTIWYESVTVIRQSRYKEWEKVMELARERVAAVVAGANSR